MFEPFSPASSITIGGSDGLTLETDESALVITGSLEVRYDQQGLDHLKQLISILQRAEAKLSTAKLPLVDADDPKPGPTKPNPFA